VPVPFFYIENFDPAWRSIELNEDTSRHIVQVLRMKQGEELNLTDGNGHVINTRIEAGHKKQCRVHVIDKKYSGRDALRITIGISLIKNASRFEWLLEKVTEIGIHEIIPLICERTEKQNFRVERMKNILISAMLQSQQCWLPVLGEPVPYHICIENSVQEQKCIAHCIENERQNLASISNQAANSKLILIGPEGDFTKEEVDLAIQHQFVPVSLGNTRLRTETAALVAATLLKLHER
jgi:16S rRNA (uracil1498-N3)-methyltransferase